MRRAREQADAINIERRERRYEIGDIVFRKPTGHLERKTHTLAPRGFGPYRIRKVISPQVVEIENMDGSDVCKDPVPIHELTDRSKRPHISLEEEEGIRSYADSLEQKDEIKDSSVKPGMREGWGTYSRGLSLIHN